MLCDVIGQTGADNQWKRECFRVVGDHEKPLMLQSLWKPKEGFSRRFEIQLRVSVEAQSLKDRDTVTAGTGLPPRDPRRGGVSSLYPHSRHCPSYQRGRHVRGVIRKQKLQGGIEEVSPPPRSYLCFITAPPTHRSVVLPIRVHFLRLVDFGSRFVVVLCALH